MQNQHLQVSRPNHSRNPPKSTQPILQSPCSPQALPFRTLDPYQPFNYMIYSTTQAQETTLAVAFENVIYTVDLIPLGLLVVSKEERESLAFMGRFSKIL